LGPPFLFGREVDDRGILGQEPLLLRDNVLELRRLLNHGAVLHIPVCRELVFDEDAVVAVLLGLRIVALKYFTGA